MTDSDSPEEFQGETPDIQGKGALGWYKPPTNLHRKHNEGEDLTQQSKPSTTEQDSFTENQAQNEKGIKPEEVELNQEFLLFDPNRTRKKDWSLGKYGDRVLEAPEFASGITLKIGNETVPLGIRTSLSRHPRGTSLTPFHLNPNLGYEITSEDFEPAKREQKLQDKTWEEYLPFDKTPSYLNISSATNLSKNGFIKDKPGHAHLHQLTEKGKESLDELKLILTFPEGTFISDWGRLHLEVYGGLEFNDFYPAETGPLSKVGVVNNGKFALFVPPSISELTKISGMFVKPTKESPEV